MPTVLIFQCVLSAIVGIFALGDPEGLLPLALFLILPVVVFQAATAFHAFLIAFTYYAVGARAVPGIIAGFFPGLSWVECIAIWAVHAGLLALVWALFHRPPGYGEAQRALRALLLFIVLSVPPVGLFHWGSPLVASGLFYPGLQIYGVLLMAALFIALITFRRSYMVSGTSVAALVLVSLGANLTYSTPPRPEGWHAMSLELGKSPSVWSDEMLAKRQAMVAIAREELQSGAKVVIFPESAAGSNLRPQLDLWQGLAQEAVERGGTILVGQETWNEARSGFQNALIGFGAEVEDNAVFASSIVPMPMGEWKLGFEKGAELNIFGSNIYELAGTRFSILMCYEDFLLWAHPGLLLGKADLLISVANQWPSSGTSSETFQDTSRHALARLAGVALLTAKNR